MNYILVISWSHLSLCGCSVGSGYRITDLFFSGKLHAKATVRFAIKRNRTIKQILSFSPLSSPYATCVMQQNMARLWEDGKEYSRRVAYWYAKQSGASISNDQMKRSQDKSLTASVLFNQVGRASGPVQSKQPPTQRSHQPHL